MTETADAVIHQTPLRDRHVALGAKLIEFGGWMMPVQYAGILEEHRAVRERAGLFDLSHMGELFVAGEEAGAALAFALVTNPPALREGRAHYSMICAPDGGVVDDLIVYRLGAERYLVVANASNAQVVSDELAARLEGFRAVLDDRSLATALVAVQGPRAVEIVTPLTDVDLDARSSTTRSPRARSPGSRRSSPGPATPARTASRCSSRRAAAAELWDALFAAGQPHGLLPIGLGARDTLRLEAGMPLYGNELDRETNPFDAGLGRVVKLDKPGDFVGRAALEKVATDGPAKRLVGLVMQGRGIARHGYPVHAGDRRTGVVTSGTQSPTLGKAIAMAYVAPADAETGTILDVEIRDQRVAAEVVDLPFYRRAGLSVPGSATGASSNRPPAAEDRGDAPQPRGGGSADDGPHGSALHEGPRVGPRRRRRGGRRDHRLRHEPAG